MRLSSKGEYALLAMLYLAQRYGAGPVPTHDIATSNAVPKKFLEQILLTLKRSGLVRSRMGPEGGYELARRPDEITLAEIVRLMDGPIAAVSSVSERFHSSTPLERSPPLIAVFRDIRNFAATKLESTTLAMLITNE